jgi:hypothetical protein
MADDRRYLIRDWGDGFWRWNCLGRYQSSEHTGIVGPPFKRDDARRMAEEHWAQAHAAACPAEPSAEGDPDEIDVIHAEKLRLIDLEDPKRLRDLQLHRTKAAEARTAQ